MGKVMAVLSGKGGTGKTTVCAGLALELAAQGCRVLCIDLDVGLRNLDIALGMAQVPALSFPDVSEGGASLLEAARHPGCEALSFLTAPVGRRPEELDQEAFARMMEAVRRTFDICLLDAPAGVGDGFRMAEALGHTVTPLRGSLVPLEARECAVLQGLSLRNVALTVYENNKKIHSDFGEMLFTHFGVSGPLILSASAHMRHFDKKQYRLEIDLKPALDEQMLDKRLLSDFEKHANSDYCNVLGALLPQKMIDEFIDRSGIPPHEKVHDITRAQRETIRTLLKRWTVNVSAPMPVENAIITSGGVKVGEIDPKTMASKKIGGLYFAGEIIDVDAYTGGYNLQIAWATGKAAGEAAADALLTQ